MENVVIIGGGPAGLSAAIYLARAGLKPLVFAGSPTGGQLTLTSEIENYPGFESILGAELIMKMRKQAEKFGAKIIDANITEVDFQKRPFKVFPSSNIHSRKNFITSLSVIIATGAKALWLGLESEKRLLGKGVSACANCDGFFFRDKVIGVVGGGDTALEEALTLTKFAKKVYLIHRRDNFRASKIMQEQVLKHPKIEIIWNSQVIEVIGKQRVEGVKIKSEILNTKLQINTKSKIPNSKRLGFSNSNLSGASNLGFRILSLDGLFVAIGHKPDTDLFKGQVKMDEKGYIITAERAAFEIYKSQILNSKSQINPKSKTPNTKRFEFGNSNLFGTSNLEFRIYRSITSILGVFAAGDCVDHVYRQAATASGAGVSAALETEKYLEQLND